jgi:glutathione S-transferase
MTAKPNEYVLFVAPNTCARVPTIALEEIGLPFETRLIRFMRNEQTPRVFVR